MELRVKAVLCTASLPGKSSRHRSLSSCPANFTRGSPFLTRDVPATPQPPSCNFIRYRMTRQLPDAEIGYGEKVSQRRWLKKVEEGIGLTARHRDAERLEVPQSFRVGESRVYHFYFDLIHGCSAKQIELNALD